MSEVHAITSAGRPQSVQSHDRIVRYLITMGIRTACFAGAFFIDGWIRWVCLAAAGVLPIIAVLIVNAGERRTRPDTLIDQVPLEPDHQIGSQAIDGDAVRRREDPEHAETKGHR
ncbi:DUF3099 domain-containing protein [Ruania halotolerans]|uniref:DUF3099 domain-containing protein n=1 Tax=Ruania halotolerans TaxID=2897773 RepID=UPI001E4224E6|nr:DUF3099 domain-containing protein [Ruania halotolerans]UFU05034.1 DUF3099 domain-containing protein [Ruania halotolerans]